VGLNSGSDEEIIDYCYRIPARFVARSNQLKIIIKPEDESDSGPDANLIRSIARANIWFNQLQTGQVTSIQDIARQETLSASYVMRYIRLAFLSPDIVETILDGRQPPGISVRKLTNGRQQPSDWIKQSRMLKTSK
jgi:hypothetical protein